MVMQAIRVTQTGGPEVLSLVELEIPAPGPGEAQVQIKAVGVNFLDVYQRSGAYPVALPFTPGQEAAGVVTAVGRGVTEVHVGDRVAYAMGGSAYAQYAVVPAWKLVPVPERLSFAQAAACLLQGLTAHFLTHSTFPIQPGHRVLVHAAAGGVGQLLVQYAKRLGATVYGTVGTPAKAELARAAGADAMLLYTEQEFAAEVRRLTGGHGVHAVYDSVGQATFAGSLASLAPRGYLVCFGQSSGPVPPVDLRTLAAHGSLFVTRTSLDHHMATRDELLSRAADLFGHVADGSLKIRIDHTWPLTQAAAAHARLESRQSTGKLLLLP